MKLVGWLEGIGGFTFGAAVGESEEEEGAKVPMVFFRVGDKVGVWVLLQYPLSQ